MNSLDRSVNNDFLVVTKSLLPYLNADRQKPVAIFIKVVELLYTINLFSNEATVHSMTRSHETGWEKDFLRDLKNNLSEDKAYFVDALLKLTEAKNLLVRQEADEIHTPDKNADYYTSSDYHMHPGDSGIPENHSFPGNPDFIPDAPNPDSESFKSSVDPAQLIKGLSAMLAPDQAQLLKTLSSLLLPQSPKGGMRDET